MTNTLTPEQQVQDLLLDRDRLAEIEELADATTDPHVAAAINDLLGHLDGMEWLILGDSGPSLGKIKRHLRVLEGIAEVYQRRVDKAIAAGDEPKGHEVSSVDAVRWAQAVLGRVSSVPLSRPIFPDEDE